MEVPLNLLRDYSVPMADKSEWDRNRAAIIPITLPWAFCFLEGMLTLNDDSMNNSTSERSEITEQANTIVICTWLMVPAVIFSVYVRLCTKIT